MKFLTYTTLFAAILFSANVFASCTQGGRTYADGDKVGPFVCQAGKWVRR